MKIQKSRDKQLLLKISQNQKYIIDVLDQFQCNEYNLDSCKFAFDLCALYMAQIGEASKLLSEDTKSLFSCFDWKITKYFRNMIDHVYEKVNPKLLKAYIFQTISPEVISEINNAINICSINKQVVNNLDDDYDRNN